MRMLDPRLYRAAFVPVLLALLVAAFSLGDRPRPIGTTLAPDAFDGVKATTTLEDLARRYPHRRPGSAADDALASELARALRGRGPYQVRLHRFRGDTIEGEQDLVDVVATRVGAPGPGIVVVAHRDAAHRGAKAELSGTAALLELARVVGDGRLRRTITFISTTGGSGGFAGAREEARRLGARADAVLVLGDLAGDAARRPFVVGFSDGKGQAPLRLRRTVEAAVRAETGADPGAPRALTQWARLAVPVTVGEQGPFGAAGQPAVLLSASGERPPPAAAPIAPGRLSAFGHAALRSLYALDNGPQVAARPQSAVVVRGKVLPGWAVRLLVAALLLPPLVAAIDGFARLRRRHEPVGRWVVWALSCALPFAVACLLAVLLAIAGLIEVAPAAPIPSTALRVGAPAKAALIVLVLVVVLGWMTLRPAALRALRAGGRPGVPGAAMGVVLAAVGTAWAMWVVNPYAAALLIPAAHVWLWVVTPESRLPRWAGAALAIAALAPLVVVWIADGRALDLGGLQAVWFWVLLVAGGHFGWVTWVLWSLVWGCAVAVVLVVLGRPAREPARPDDVTVRGPVSYAGPGSLGGTESALRR